MLARRKHAWITIAVDEATTQQAIVLAKSLSRVVTAAETVVLISYDLPDHLGLILSNYYDNIITIDLGEKQNNLKLPKLELFAVFSWNLTMYSKCIFLHSNKMVVRNCDELFDLKEDISGAWTGLDNGRKVDTSILVIKPSFRQYKAISNLSTSGQKNLSDIINMSFGTLKFSKLHSKYNFNIMDASARKAKYVISIASLGDSPKPYVTNGNNSKSNTNSFVKLQQYWLSCWKEAESAIKASSSSVNIGNPADLLPKNNITVEKREYYKDAIAIVGQSCRFPGANNVAEFWELIKSGGDGICSVPAERLFEFQQNDPRFTESKAGFLKCPIDEFDAKFFGISPREAAFMDPQQRLLLEVAWEALENAAINPQTLKGSNTGVFTGVWTHDYERLITENTTGQDFHHVILGNAFSATSARVSYFLGLNGPNVATESGCSSSFVGLHLACDSLRKRESDLGLVLGCNIIIVQLPLAEIPILAKDGHCKTFDESADGFGRAEGVAVIVLKRLSDAIKNGDRILGVIRGTAISNEGTSSNFGTPSKLCQEIAIKDALKNAGVCPGDVDYVEAHGTGTPIGDPIEFAAISSGYTGERKEPLVIGSVKTNTGHTESAAGLAGLIKVILAMENQVIPPHVNFTKLNPSIDLSVVPAIIPVESRTWTRNSERVRIAGVSSFGISGTNVHVILEEPPIEGSFRPIEINSTITEPPLHILTLSAKSENALKDTCSNYMKYFSDNPNANICDVSFTSNTGRAYLKYRVSVTGSNISELKNGLEAASYTPPEVNEKPKIAFLFTGQGSQYLGMAKSLYQSNVDFRSAFDECEVIIDDYLGISIKEGLWPKSDNDNLLDKALYSQLSIFAVEYSLLRLWQEMGVIPDVVLGHSVGEFAAATAVGIIDLKSALVLLAERSRLIQSLPPGGMLAVRSSKDKVVQLISEFSGSNPNKWIDMAVINSNEEVVVAGNKSTLEEFTTLCTYNGIKFQMLAASHAFHSREMDKISKHFAKFTSQVTYKPPKYQYVSGTTGSLISDNEIEDGTYWLRHAREPVNFQKGINTLQELGCNVFIEIGSHPVLLALGMTNLNSSDNKLWLPSLRRNKEDWQTILESVGTLFANGVNINWEPLYKGFLPKKLELPTYPFQRQRYWIDVSTEGLERAIHPLLGKRLMLADVDGNVYEQKWNLEDLAYIKDHQVAHIIILPGAGFLEIILAAGKDMLLKNKDEENGIVVVKDFVVEAPFELEEGKRYKTQVVLTPVENEHGVHHVRIYLYRKLNGYNEDKGWKRYSSGKVMLRESVSWNSDEKASKEEENSVEQTYVAEEIETIKSRCLTEKESSEFYKLAPEIGIYFGETFQSIEMVWAGENEAIGLIPLPVNAGNIKEYVYHPIILDAMIQLFGLSIGKENVDLYLPVGVEHFFMVNDTLSECVYAHAKWAEGISIGTVALYSDKNILLAVMAGVRLLRTSVGSFLNVINSHKNMLPGMYQEIWRQRVGPLQSRIDFKKITGSELVLEPLITKMEKHMHMFDIECSRQADTSVCCGIMKMFLQNEFSPKLGQTYWTEEHLYDRLISPTYSMLMQRYFAILCEDGYGEEIIDDSGTMNGFKCIKEFPSLDEIERREKSVDDYIYKEGASVGRTITADILHKSMTHNWDVIQGKQTAISALFGRDDMNPLDVYTKSNECIVASMRAAHYLGLSLQEFKSDGKHEDSIVRIVEIGAGSGATSKEILAVLQKEEIPFRYTFTDISPHFLEGAKENFSTISGIDYKVLDIEKDPGTQGFCPNSYDVVVAANVIHATEDLRKSVANIRKLISTGGILVLQEIIEPSRAIDAIFGILEGYWKFTDYDIRKRHSMVSQNIWNKVLDENGFSKSVNMSSKDEFIAVLGSRALDKNVSLNTVSNVLSADNIKETAWVIYCEEGIVAEHLETKLSPLCDTVLLLKGHKQMEHNSRTNYLYTDHTDADLKALTAKMLNKYDVKGVIYLATHTTDENRDSVYKSMLSVCQYLSENAHHNMKFVIVTKGVYFLQGQKIVNPFNGVIWGMTKSLRNENPKMEGKIVDLDPDVSDPKGESQEIFFEIFDTDELLVCYRNAKKYVARFVTLPKQLAPLHLPKGRYRIDIPKSKKINDVSFIAIEKDPLGPKMVEVIVKAVGFNFRDIFVIIKPEMYRTVKETVGSDFSGIVSALGSEVTKFKVGDEVYGVSVNSAVASHAMTHEDIIMHKPKELTFADASTIPTVLLTAFHCMVGVANLKKDEYILIHVASGGVGLIAIQIAIQIGAKIIVTAGSHRKRNYLRNLGIEHVFHSRDLTYGDEIARVTNGQGVDMVLNSLTGNGFKETTLKACAPNARFVEIGKVNIWKPEEVYELRPDVQYTIVDLEQLTETETGDLIQQLKSYCNPEEEYTTLPYSSFDVVNVRDALNYLMKVQHIGKVVVTMPDITEIGNQLIKNSMLFNRNATYLITGGLGGIGLEVAKWMTDSGCKNLILVGRSPPSEYAVQVLNSMKAKGCRVCSFQVDVGNFEQCKALFENFDTLKTENRLPPLRGVIHSAGVISDAIYANQTWEKYETVFNAKLSGCMNLHNLTKKFNLEHFVLFSSMAGVFGPMAQSNHAAANAFLDSFARYRHSIGLPAQTINWGAWAEVGAAKNTTYGKEGLFGVKPFSPNQGIATLKFIMNRPDLLQVGVVQVEINEFKQYFGIGNILSELNDDKSSTEIIASSVQSEKFWAEIGPLSLEERNQYIKAQLTAIIRKTLKLPDSETIDEFQTFQEMGLDSLMAVEMKNKLQNIVGKKITLNVAAMMDYPTINSLSKYLAEQTMTVENENNTPAGENGGVKSEAKEFDSEAMYQLVKQDSILPDEIISNGRNVSPKSASEMTNILFTGVTGHFGIHLLRELLKNDDKFNMCCLIRGKSIEHARRKLVANLKKYDLFQFVSIDKISVIAGDITEEHFGLPHEEYNRLSSSTDMVFHFAAKANHVERYQVNKVNRMDIRSINVLGTVNILKFAANIKTKRVVYPSSFSTINRFTSDGFIYEEFPDDENNADDLTLGYAVSKFVCEKLLKQANNERGIPCTVIRYSSLMGHSETGRFTIDTNTTLNSFFLSLRMGIIPDMCGSFYGIPVDIASQLTVELVFNNKTHPGVYNLVQPVPMQVEDFITAAQNAGHTLTLVSLEEFQEKLKEEVEKSSFLTIFKDSYGAGLTYSDLTTAHPVLKREMHGQTIANRISEKVSNVVANVSQRIPNLQSIFHIYYEFGSRSGQLERFGI